MASLVVIAYLLFFIDLWGNVDHTGFATAGIRIFVVMPL